MHPATMSGATKAARRKRLRQSTDMRLRFVSFSGEARIARSQSQRLIEIRDDATPIGKCFFNLRTLEEGAGVGRLQSRNPGVVVGDCPFQVPSVRFGFSAVEIREDIGRIYGQSLA